MSREGDGLRLTAAITDGGLDLRAESDPLPELTYTAETSAERVRESEEDTRESREPAAGILESLKPVLSGAITILILTIIILIILRWQRRKQDP